MRPTVIPLDPGDDAAVDAALSLVTAAQRADVPDFPPPCPYDFRGSLRESLAHRRTERYLAHSDGTVVGYLALSLPLRDNQQNAEVELVVHPGHRRRGVGRLLHGYAEARLRELGRRRLVGGTVEALPDGPAGDPAGSAFATAMGAKVALVEVRRRWEADTVDPDPLTALASAARERAAGYRVVTWSGRTPDDYATDVAYLNGRLLTDAPLGDLDWEAERIDVARLREAEESALGARSMSLFAAGAVHEESGRMVALTVIGQHRSTPWHAWQWITLVDPAHRGHRLGALVKVENLWFARALRPELRVIDTWNAAVNDHMISINEQMGYRAVDRWPGWQRELPSQ